LWVLKQPIPFGITPATAANRESLLSEKVLSLLPETLPVREKVRLTVSW